MVYYMSSRTWYHTAWHLLKRCEMVSLRWKPNCRVCQLGFHRMTTLNVNKWKKVHDNRVVCVGEFFV